MSKAHCDPEFTDDPFYDPDLAEAEHLGWQDAEMERLERHLSAGKTISSPDLAKILRVTLDAEIPKSIRLVIADLLDPAKKTGRSRRCRYFGTADSIFRDATIQRIYSELREGGMKSIDAMNKVGEQFNLGYETIRTIVKSKKKS